MGLQKNGTCQGITVGRVNLKFIEAQKYSDTRSDKSRVIEALLLQPFTELQSSSSMRFKQRKCKRLQGAAPVK
jgi:hypothetical protein